MIGRRDSESTEVELLTERLRVRPLDEGDRTALAAILGDADVMRFVGAGRPLGPEEIDDGLAHARRAHRDQGLGPFSVCLAQGGAVIGYCGIWTGEDTGELELNDALAPTYCGRGFGQEAAGAVLRYADRRLDVIRATADPTNAPSLRILERLGFTRTHTAPDVHGLPTVFLARRRPPSSRPDDAGRSANTTRRELSREPNQEPTTARPGKHPGRPATPGTPPRA